MLPFPPLRPVPRLFEVNSGGEPGYDHSFARVPVHGDYDAAAPEVAIVNVEDPVSGRRMVVSTTQPGTW